MQKTRNVTRTRRNVVEIPSKDDITTADLVREAMGALVAMFIEVDENGSVEMVRNLKNNRPSYRSGNNRYHIILPEDSWAFYDYEEAVFISKEIRVSRNYNVEADDYYRNIVIFDNITFLYPGEDENGDITGEHCLSFNGGMIRNSFHSKNGNSKTLLTDITFAGDTNIVIRNFEFIRRFSEVIGSPISSREGVFNVDPIISDEWFLKHVHRARYIRGFSSHRRGDNEGNVTWHRVITNDPVFKNERFLKWKED